MTLRLKAEFGEARAAVESAIASDSDDCILWRFYKDHNGYGRVGINGKVIGAHRYVLIATHGKPRGDRTQAAHSCGVRSCINPRHLRWATPLENAADRRVHGTERCGEDSPRARHTNAQVNDALAAYRSGESCSAIARRMGCNPSTVSRWVSGARRQPRHPR